MNFESELQTCTKEVNSEIQTILEKWQEEVKKIHPQLVPFIDAFAKACSGGKRIRGFLVKAGFDLVSPKENKDIFKVAAAIEIMHTAILVHDDIIDKSPLRRGQPTVYKTFGGDHYGISQAISVGDAGFFLAVQLVSESSFLPELKTEAIRCFVRGMKITTLGELLDVTLSQKKSKKRESDVISITLLKTAQYTFISPLQIGAILGGAKGEVLTKISDFGKNIGISFQIQDDILGVFGEEKIVGKSVFSDIEEGKNTLLINYAMDHGTMEQKKILNTHYGTGAITQKIYEEIQTIFKETGALHYSEEKSNKYMNYAKEYIKAIQVKETDKNVLYELISFLEKRKS